MRFISADQVVVIREKGRMQEVLTRKETPSLAVHISVIRTDLLHDIRDEIAKIPYPFDLYLSVADESVEDKVKQVFEGIEQIGQILTIVSAASWSDGEKIFLHMKDDVLSYRYLVHFHTDFPEDDVFSERRWKFLLRHTFGSEAYISSVLETFEEDSTIGIIMPPSYPLSSPEKAVDNQAVAGLLRVIGRQVPLPEELTYPAGSICWMRVDAIQSLFAKTDSITDGKSAIEKTWVYLSQANGYSYRIFQNMTDSEVSLSANRIGILTHYDIHNRVSDVDLEMIRRLRPFFQELVIVSDSNLGKKERQVLKTCCDRLLLRNPSGFEMTAYKQTIGKIGRDELCEYDQLVLLHLDGVGPVCDLNQIFSTMDEYDFWSVSSEPDFLVFNQNVINSDVFWKFWMGYHSVDDRAKEMPSGEEKMAETISAAGFSFGTYLPEAKVLNMKQNPLTFALLGAPFLKKESNGLLSNEDRKKLRAYLAQLSISEELRSFFDADPEADAKKKQQKKQQGGLIRKGVQVLKSEGPKAFGVKAVRKIKHYL